MTDLVPYRAPAVSSLELAPQAWKLAEKIAGTDFVPTALRGKPEAVLACILAGHEAGISPMQALAKIHIIEGRPAMAAELMRALVLQHGHELNYDEVSTTSVTASGRRRGSERWTKVTWTLDDAKRGGLDAKTNWRRWPRAMLIARATAELCRMIFPDVLAGISHTVEELSDGEQVDGLVDFGPPEIVTATTTAPPARTARAAKAITKAGTPVGDGTDQLAAPPPPARGEVAGLPGDDDEPEAAEVVEVAPPSAPAAAQPIETTATEADEDWPAGDWPSDPELTPPKRYNGPQLLAIKLHERFQISGSGPDARALRLAAISHLLGRPIESSKDLTPAEFTTVAEAIDNWPEDQPLPVEVFDAAEPAPNPSGLAPHIGSDEQTTPDAATVGSGDPEAWTGDEWRALLTRRKVKVTEALREAQRLAAMNDPAPPMAMLDDLAGSGIAAALAGWVEDRTLKAPK